MRTQKAFIDKLQRLMLWKYSNKEILDILNDYKEYFEVGFEKGKTEIQLCQELGNPRDIVRALDSERKIEVAMTKKRRRLNFRVLLSILLCVLTGYILFVPSHNDYNYIIYEMTLFEPVLIIAIWLILGKNTWIEYQQVKVNDRRIIFFHILYLVVDLFIYIFLKQVVVVQENGKYIFGLVAEDIGPISVLLMKTLIVGLLITSMYALYQYRHYSRIYYSVFCHSVGIIGVLASYIKLVTVLVDATYYFRWINWSQVIYIEGIIFGVIFIFYQVYCRGED